MKQPYSILWVCKSGYMADQRRKQFGGNARFVSIGAALAGRSFDEIVLDFSPADSVIPGDPYEIPKAREWLEGHLPIKLLPGGVIRTLS